MNIKKTSLLAAAVAVFSAMPAAAQTAWNDYKADSLGVYYQGQKVDGADAASFSELGFGYGKDKHNVYYRGEVLEFVDPEYFRVDAKFTRRHSISAAPGLHPGKHLPVVRPPKKVEIKEKDDKKGSSSIEDFFGLGTSETGEYAVSDGRVTYEGTVVKGADAATFEPLKAGYARDKRHGYYKGKVISNAIGGKHFTYSGDDYATDGLRTYFKGKEVDRD